MPESTSRQAVVVGGSIGGLTTALLLRDLGWDVDVFERSTRDDARGGGIVLQPDTIRWFAERSTQALERLTTSTNLVQYLGIDNDVAHREYTPWSYSSWATLHSALLRDFGADRYWRGHCAVAVAQNASTATVEFDNGIRGRGELSGPAVRFTEHTHPVLRLRRLARPGARTSVEQRNACDP